MDYGRAPAWSFCWINIDLALLGAKSLPQWTLELVSAGELRSELTAAELDIPPLRSQKQNLTDKIVHRQIEFSVKLPQELLDANSLKWVFLSFSRSVTVTSVTGLKITVE